MTNLAYLLYLCWVFNIFNLFRRFIRLNVNLIFFLLYNVDIVICIRIDVIVVATYYHKGILNLVILSIFQQSILIFSRVILSLLFILNIFNIDAHFSIAVMDVNLNNFIARIVVIFSTSSLFLLIVLLVHVYNLYWIHFRVQNI